MVKTFSLIFGTTYTSAKCGSSPARYPCPSTIHHLEKPANNAKLRDSSVRHNVKGVKQRQFEQILPTGQCSKPSEGFEGSEEGAELLKANH